MQIDEQLLYQRIGARIKQQRVQNNLTQSDLATTASMLRTSITNIETGRQKTPLHVLYKLCLILDIDIRSLLPPAVEVVRVPSHDSADRRHANEFPKATQALKELIDE